MANFFEWVWLLIQFFIGINVVVFFHELGHFLAARWAGIKVERFALGIGPRLIGLVKGETDYCLCAFPIGGYVKMLGQEDFKPLEANEKPLPRSFEAAPVGKRFVVIAAGVVMNVLLAPVLFTTLIIIGMNFPALYVGGTTPTFPASQAVIQWPGQNPPESANPSAKGGKWTGLQSGDLITAVNGEEVARFGDLKMAAILAGPDDKFTIDFERKIDGKDFWGKTTIGVKQQESLGAPIFGLSPASNTTFAKHRDLIVASPLKPGDEIVAINAQPIEFFWQIEPVVQKITTSTVAVTVRRDGKDLSVNMQPSLMNKADIFYLADGKRLKAWAIDANVEKKEVTLETPDGEKLTMGESQIAGGRIETLLDILGLVPRMKISAIAKGSPAEKAGLEPGDIIVSYADRPNPTIREFLEISREIGDTQTRITVLREGRKQTLDIKPAKRNGSVLIGITNAVDTANLLVASLRKGSPAADGGVEVDAEIKAVNGQPVGTWIDLFEALKKLRGQEILLTCKLGDLAKTYSLGKLTAEVFEPENYEITLFSQAMFEPMTVHIVHRNPITALGWGFEETYGLILSSYRSIYSMILGRVSASKQARGPVGIAVIAMETARRGLTSLVYLMTFISLALAVFNFLPLPVLDGGYAVLLIIEKIRGKPLPLKVVNVIQMVGLVLILSLAVLLTYQDIAREISNMW